MNNIFLSVIIPAYKEGNRIQSTLLSLDYYFRDKSYGYEIIVVNDGSPDNTAEVVRSYVPIIKNLRLIDNKENHGKGYAVKCGMMEACGEYRLFMDADNSVTIQSVEEFAKEIENGYDVVIGSIAFNNNAIEHNGWYRRVLGKLSKFLIRNVATPGIYDTQRGYKLFTAKAAKAIFKKQTINRFGFDIELLTIARVNKFKVKEMPVAWDNPTGSKVTPWSYVQTFQELIRILFNRFLGKYYFDKPNYLGEAKINMIKVFFGSIHNHIKLRSSLHGEENRPIDFDNKKDFLFLPKVFSAKKHFYSETIILLSLVSLAVVSIVSFLNLVFGI